MWTLGPLGPLTLPGLLETVTLAIAGQPDLKEDGAH